MNWFRLAFGAPGDGEQDDLIPGAVGDAMGVPGATSIDAPKRKKKKLRYWPRNLPMREDFKMPDGAPQVPETVRF